MSLKIGKHISKDRYDGESSLFVTKGKSSSSESTIATKNELVSALERLRDNSNVKLTKLSGSLKDDFRLIDKYVGQVHQTNSYRMYKDLIDEKFNDLNEVVPGTIGAYLHGGSIKVNLDPEECAAIRANTIPQDGDSWLKCKQSVFLADRTSSGYDISLLSAGEDKSHAKIYVRHQNYEEFEGFSHKEKDKLRNHGVEHIQLYGYSNGDGNYEDLIGSTININDCKSRKHDHHRGSHDDESNGLGWVWLLVVFFIVIIIICALVWALSDCE